MTNEIIPRYFPHTQHAGQAGSMLRIILTAL